MAAADAEIHLWLLMKVPQRNKKERLPWLQMEKQMGLVKRVGIPAI
uniref:Euchromatic histone methyltransferase 1 n=1 Tax=Mus musculus TaxID=10090 RepID=A0A0G2JEQ4_MOUSE